jgi:hypothetical protein
MEARDELHATRGAHGVHCYNPVEVERHAEKCEGVDGHTSAEAFRLFRGGEGWRNVVLKLGISPRIARYLWAEWRTPLGAPGPTPPWETPAQTTEAMEFVRDEGLLEEWERQMREQMSAQEAEWREDEEARRRRRAECRAGVNLRRRARGLHLL